MDLLAGGANLELKLNSRGNRLSTLRENADGQVRFNLAQGEFRRMNLTHMACQGIALVNQESLTTTDWGSTTPFNDMNGTLVIKGNTLNNTQLVASLAGMKLEGQGTVDLARSHLDYEAGLRIVGEVHRDPACRVTEYVENVVIPVECRGNFTEDPAGLCSFDGSRFRDTLKAIAANAAKAKAKKELEKARSKAEDKVKEKLEDKILQKEKELNLLKNSINEFRRGNVVIKKGQSLFIAEVDSNKNLNIKLELSNIINRANKYVQEIVIPSKKEPTNILLWRPSDIAKIENLIEKNGSWILIIKSATNVLKGDDYVFVFPELLENKLVVKKGTIITTTILEKSDLTSKSINNTINLLIKQTRDAVKKKGSIVNEITTRGNFLKKLKDYLKSDQNVKFQLEVLSLRDSKTAEPIIVEFNITKLQP